MVSIQDITKITAPWQINTIVAEYIVFIGNNPPTDICRYFQGITEQGYFLVQDFYKNTHIKFTEPFSLKSLQHIPLDCFELLETFPTAFLTDYIQYYMTGEKHKEIIMTGNEQFVSTTYYPSGQKFSINHYVQGKTVGTFIKWHENGQLASETFYKNGKCHGIYQDWDELGRKWREGQCDNGEDIGTMIIWDNKGNIKKIVH